MTVPRALTVAGSDPTGGAGIQRDIKTFQALGVWGMTAITAVTVQDSLGVSGWTPISPSQIVAQIDACFDDIGVDALKTGMLPDPRTIEAVGEAITRRRQVPFVLDPVMVATSGGALTSGDGTVDALVAHLIPRAWVVTPNTDEAERLTGRPVDSIEAQLLAARAIREMGAGAVLVTGGHLPGEDAVDVLVDDQGAEHYEVARVDTKDTHGTGCMLSAAITAGLAKGAPLRQAISAAKEFVTAGLKEQLRLGRGVGPVGSWGVGPRG